MVKFAVALITILVVTYIIRVWDLGEKLEACNQNELNSAKCAICLRDFFTLAMLCLAYMNILDGVVFVWSVFMCVEVYLAEKQQRYIENGAEFLGLMATMGLFYDTNVVCFAIAAQILVLCNAKYFKTLADNYECQAKSWLNIVMAIIILSVQEKLIELEVSILFFIGTIFISIIVFEAVSIVAAKYIAWGM